MILFRASSYLWNNTLASEAQVISRAFGLWREEGKRREKKSTLYIINIIIAVYIVRANCHFDVLPFCMHHHQLLKTIN